MFIKNKRIVSILLCLVFLIVSLPLSALVFANTSQKHIIWEANADKMTALGGKVNVSDEETNIVMKKYDTNGGFYQTKFDSADEISNTEKVTVYSGTKSTDSGFGWLTDKNVLNKIRPFLKLSFQYRLVSENTLPEDAMLTIWASNGNNKELAKLVSVAVSESSDWQKVDMIELSSDFSSAWKDSYISWEISSASAKFKGYQLLDIRGLIITVDENDRNAFNKAVDSVRNVNRIDNFTRGVTIPTLQGVKDYYSLFKGYDSKTRYTLNKHDNLFDVSLIESENLDFSVSQTSAKGELNDETADTVQIDVALAEGFEVEKVVVTNIKGEELKVTRIAKDKTFSFKIVDSDVQISVVAVAKDPNKLALLWYMQAGANQITPWFEGPSWPASYSYYDTGEETAYKFEAIETNGVVTLFGSFNKLENISDYYETAVVTFKMKVGENTPNRILEINTDVSGGLSKQFSLTNEWQYFTVPLRELTTSPDLHYFRVIFGAFEKGESFIIGSAYIWSRDTGKSNADNLSAIWDISGYKKEVTNKLIGTFAYAGQGSYPWDENASAYINWDTAWYAKFNDETPYVFKINKEAESINQYQMCMYNSNIPATDDGFMNLSEYIETGYMEFYLKTSSEKATIPLCFQYWVDGARLYMPMSIEYDVTKARPDGYMCFRIPLTFFEEFGVNLDDFRIIAIMGAQTLPDEMYFSPIRFYSNYADIEILDDIPEKEEIEERDLPIDLDTTIINAQLDKERKELLVPEKTYLWEILSAIKLDSNDVVVNFLEDKEILIDNNEIVTEGMIMELYRRGELLEVFDIYYVLE